MTDFNTLSTEAATEAWTRIAKEHQAAVRRAQVEREALDAELRLLSPVLSKRAATTPLEIYRYYQISDAMFRKSLAILDLMNLTEQAPPIVAIKPQLEAMTMEVQLFSTQLEAIQFARLLNILEVDLAAAVAGTPPARELPKPYMQGRERIHTDQAWAEALTRFLQEGALFVNEIHELESQLPEIMELEPKERFAALKTANVAALAGQAFRLRGIFRLLDGGEAFLAGFKIPRPKAEPAKKGLTDRLGGVFRGKGK